ncbi:uncharacterized protein LOC142339175 [Convolutriloba macropyga]|uniref:uncharacterized protein LOC142339175 n=1 Tax=Convolutriloba macropyga TaxID=536237 RepID=UPI003F520ABF
MRLKQNRSVANLQHDGRGRGTLPIDGTSQDRNDRKTSQRGGESNGGAGDVATNRNKSRHQKSSRGRDASDGLFVKYQSAFCILTVFGVTAALIMMSSKQDEIDRKESKLGPKQTVKSSSVEPSTKSGEKNPAVKEADRSDRSKDERHSDDRPWLDTISAFPSETLVPFLKDNISWIGLTLLVIYFVREYIMDYYYSNKESQPDQQSSDFPKVSNNQSEDGSSANTGESSYLPQEKLRVADAKLICPQFNLFAYGP